MGQKQSAQVLCRFFAMSAVSTYVLKDNALQLRELTFNVEANFCYFAQNWTVFTADNDSTNFLS